MWSNSAFGDFNKTCLFLPQYSIKIGQKWLTVHVRPAGRLVRIFRADKSEKSHKYCVSLKVSEAIKGKGPDPAQLLRHTFVFMSLHVNGNRRSLLLVCVASGASHCYLCAYQLHSDDICKGVWNPGTIKILAVKQWRAGDITLYTVLTWVLCASEWSDLRFGRFIPE